MKIYNTIQNGGTVMHLLVQNLKIKNGEQLKPHFLSLYTTHNQFWRKEERINARERKAWTRPPGTSYRVGCDKRSVAA